jgi:hypothetical protein
MLGTESLVYSFLFYIFVLLSALTVLNMLIGVLCEVVAAVASTEKESLTVAFVHEKLQHVMKNCGLDEDGDGEISKEEFCKILENRDACMTLQEVGVDVCGLVDVVDFIFAEREQDEDNDDGDGEPQQLSFGDFMEIVLQLRGSNNATVKDVVDLRKFIVSQNEKLEEKFNHAIAGSKHVAKKARNNSKVHMSMSGTMSAADSMISQSSSPGSSPTRQATNRVASPAISLSPVGSVDTSTHQTGSSLDNLLTLSEVELDKLIDGVAESLKSPIYSQSIVRQTSDLPGVVNSQELEHDEFGKLERQTTPGKVMPYLVNGGSLRLTADAPSEMPEGHMDRMQLEELHRRLIRLKLIISGGHDAVAQAVSFLS